MFSMSSTSINASMYTLDDGPSYHIKGPVKVANGLTGINNAMVKPHFILNWRRMV